MKKHPKMYLNKYIIKLIKNKTEAQRYQYREIQTHTSPQIFLNAAPIVDEGGFFQLEVQTDLRGLQDLEVEK